MKFVHYDEAQEAAIVAIRRWMNSGMAIEKALLVTDLFGKLRLILWSKGSSFEALRKTLEDEMKESRPWWTGEILLASEADELDREVWENAWREARTDTESPKFRTLSRHRSRTAWFAKVEEPLWEAPENGPGIIVFYSFKGGVGRSTALASFAIQRARSGERVAVVDFDLDAPGIGRLLSVDAQGHISRWGVVDYLVERLHGDAPLEDYFHRCTRVSGAGDIVVFPSGTLDEGYSDKLARVDFEEPPRGVGSPIVSLLEDVKKTVDPKWILLDARTGVSESAGHLLSGFAHLHALFGTTSEQSWSGLRMVIDRLGRQRILAGQPQANILLVQAMVPPTPEAARLASEFFRSRAQNEFIECYYAEVPGDPSDTSSSEYWDVRDLDSADAPHVPVAITYDQRLADFRDITEITDVLCDSAEYKEVTDRILGHFETES